MENSDENPQRKSYYNPFSDHWTLNYCSQLLFVQYILDTDTIWLKVFLD